MYQLIHTGFIILLSVILIEVILKASWNHFYFTKAVTISKKTIEITDLEKAEKRINSFITQMDKTDGFEKYKGIKAGEGLFFYRHKLITLSRNNSSGIHGTISLDSENRCVTIKWNLNYSLLAMLIFFAFFFISSIKTEGMIILLPFLIILVFLAISIALERSKFNRLVTEVKYLINRWY